MIEFVVGLTLGFLAYVFFRVVLTGFYVIPPDQRAVITTFGKADR